MLQGLNVYYSLSLWASLRNTGDNDITYLTDEYSMAGKEPRARNQYAIHAINARSL